MVLRIKHSASYRAVWLQMADPGQCNPRALHSSREFLAKSERVSDQQWEGMWICLTHLRLLRCGEQGRHPKPEGPDPSGGNVWPLAVMASSVIFLGAVQKAAIMGRQFSISDTTPGLR